MVFEKLAQSFAKTTGAASMNEANFAVALDECLVQELVNFEDCFVYSFSNQIQFLWDRSFAGRRETNIGRQPAVRRHGTFDRMQIGKCDLNLLSGDFHQCLSSFHT